MRNLSVSLKSRLRAAIERAGFEIAPDRKLRRRHLWGKDYAEDVRLLAQLQKADLKTVCVLGAYHGDGVLYLARKFPRATIHAFEPVAVTYAALLKNVGGGRRLPQGRCGRCRGVC